MLRSFLAFTLLLIASGPATPATETVVKVAPFLYTVAKVFEPMAWPRVQTGSHPALGSS